MPKVSHKPLCVSSMLFPLQVLILKELGSLDAGTSFAIRSPEEGETR